MAGSCLLFIATLDAWAGPPFVTDDPEPVEFHHWEIYFASMYNHGGDGTTGTAPHIDANYGIAAETHLNMTVPFAYASLSSASHHFGLGDIDLGVKHRFLGETAYCPQAAIFPHITLPTGNSTDNLGLGHVSAFIPIWLQKSYGDWSTFAGGGYWFNKTAAGEKDYWQSGLVLQRNFGKAFSLGAEIFNFTQEETNAPAETGLNAGATINFNNENHLLLSVGTDASGPNAHFAYLAFQWTN